MSIYGRRGRPPKVTTTLAKIERETRKLKKAIKVYLVFEKLHDECSHFYSGYLFIMACYCRIAARNSAEEIIAARRRLSVAT